ELAKRPLEETRAGLARLVVLGTPLAWEFPLASGTQALEVRPVRDPGGAEIGPHVLGFACVLRDVTPEKELAAVRADLPRLFWVKVRSLLMPLAGSTELLRRGGDEPLEREFAVSALEIATRELTTLFEHFRAIADPARPAASQRLPTDLAEL